MGPLSQQPQQPMTHTDATTVERPARSLSLLWRLIRSRPLGLGPQVVHWALVLGGAIFAIPRWREGWFLWAAPALPLSMFCMLQLIKHVQNLLNRIEGLGLDLVESGEDRKQLESWWKQLDQRVHVLWCLFFALVLAGVSLVFNANPRWTRYTDALGFLYQGFVAGEVLYLLLLLPLWMYQLHRFPLRLNPFDPANTVGLCALAETAFGVALATGLSLLAVNLVILAASYLFRHLLFGVVFVSASAWVAVIILAGYPHLVLWRIVHETRQATLQALEGQFIRRYREILDGRSPGPLAASDTLELYRHLLSSKTFPISNSTLLGILSTLLVNAVPLIVRHLIK